MNRRQILTGTAATLAFLTAAPAAGVLRSALADPGEVFDDDHILGAADAPVTIIEFSSLTCPHCAAFHRETLPSVKSEWIDTGKARLVYRNFPLDGLALLASAVTEGFEGDKYFSFLDSLFKNQQTWTRVEGISDLDAHLKERCAAGAPPQGEDPLAALKLLAKVAGMDDASFEAQICDEAAMDAIMLRARDGAETYDVRSTPTLVVNGEPIAGALPYEEFAKRLEQAAAKS